MFLKASSRGTRAHQASQKRPLLGQDRVSSKPLKAAKKSLYLLIVFVFNGVEFSIQKTPADREGLFNVDLSLPKY
jgi:hypothetical protein